VTAAERSNRTGSTRDQRIGRRAGFVIWGLAAIVVVELLAIAINLGALVFGGGTRNAEFDPEVGAPTNYGATRLAWGGQLVAVAPWWLVMIQVLVSIAVIIVIWPPHRWYVGRVGRVFVLGVPIIVAGLLVIVAVYCVYAGELGPQRDLGLYRIPMITAIVVAVIEFARAVVMVAPVAARGFRAQARDRRSARAKAGRRG